MAVTVTPQAEPIPGYRLLERLGQGGFGEVWKVEAPGGLAKAIKIVHGNLEAGGEDEIRVRQELKALERVKTVRHPFILSLERFDIVDNRLFIVMELADRSLHERFKECQRQGLPGIPREELLRYMEETAEALDLMNIQYQLQHLDIKPQNLFLVYNHVKVGDFGLVKDLEGMRAFATSGLTPVYAAPETFEGLVSRFCDQYNLGIVYQELLTGKLPFQGTSPRHLMMQHLTGQPDLTPLPPQDRAAIRKALAKKPEDRHATCLDLVRELRRNVMPEMVLGTEALDVEVSDSGKEAAALFQSKQRAAVPQTALFSEVPSLRTTVQFGKKAEPSTEKVVTPVIVEEALPPERPKKTGDGVLFPALVVGLGGLALHVLHQLRKALHKRCGPPSALPHLQMLWIDTDPDALQEAKQGEPDMVLKEEEALLARLQRPTHYLKPGREHQLAEQWLNMGLLSRLPRDQVTSSGCRAMGRLAYVMNYAPLAARFRSSLAACVAPEAMAAAEAQTGLGLRTNYPRVYVIASLAGGTGGGMFLDVAYTLRHQLKQMGYRNPDLVGIGLLPAAEHDASSTPEVQNAHAALRELHHFSSSTTTFSADYLDCERPLVDREAPFRRCVLLALPSPPPGKPSAPSDWRPLAALVGDFLSRDLTTPLGPIADTHRGQMATSSSDMLYQTFGAYWFTVPRRLLLQRVAQKLCHQLTQSWRSGGASASSEVFQSWIREQMASVALDEEGLKNKLLTASRTALGLDPEAAFEDVLQRLAPGGPGDFTRHPQTAAHALEELERLVGLSEKDGPSGPSLLANALTEIAPVVGSEIESQLADMALRVLAEPRFRLLGTEEAFPREIGFVLKKVLQDQKATLNQLAVESGQLQDTAQRLLQNLSKRSLLWGGNKGHFAVDLMALLRSYPKTRCKALVLRWVHYLHQDLLANLHLYLREVGCCRPRISQFMQTFAAAVDRRQQVDLGLGQYLLPTGCRTLEEGAARVLGSLTPEELHDLQEEVQDMLRKKLQQQVHVCTAPASFFKNLEEEVHERIAALVEAHLGREHAAELYLEQRGEDQAALEDLAAAFDEAVPELTCGRSSRSEMCILAVPPGTEGEYFRGLVGRALPKQEFIAAASTDDIVFFREQTNLALTSLPHLSPAVEEVYRQALAANQFTPHSRFDIAAWQSLHL